MIIQKNRRARTSSTSQYILQLDAIDKNIWVL